MSQIILLDNEYITTVYVPDKDMIYHTVHQHITGPNLWEALKIGSDALIENGAYKWLSDDRKNGPLSPEDIEWSAVNFQPRTIEGGWKYWAIVVPEAVIAAGALVSTMEALYELGLRMMTFSSVEAAEEWLDNV